jgi:hypothetical protein
VNVSWLLSQYNLKDYGTLPMFHLQDLMDLMDKNSSPPNGEGRTKEPFLKLGDVEIVVSWNESRSWSRTGRQWE